MNKKRKGIVLLLLAFLLSVILGIPHTEPVLAATPRLNKTNVSLVKGGQVKLSVAGTSKKVKWSSTQKKVAVVTNNGLVRAKSKGTARIIAKVGKKRLICHVVVRRPKENVTTGGLSLSATRISIKAGKFKQLRAFGTNKKISWYSTDESIAAVSKDGVVYGVSPGNCRIYAEIPGKYAICMVSVFGGTQNTPTPTIWNTPVATITQAPTPIPTETYLPTPTSQPTPTYLPTPTARPTQVPTTPTPTPIVVVTQTPTPIPTSRPTVVVTPTPQPTQSPTIVPVNRVVYQDANTKITYSGIRENWLGYQFDLTIENFTSRTLVVQVRETSINGFMVDPICSIEVAPRKKVQDNFLIFGDDATRVPMNAVRSVETKFHIFDWDDLDFGYDTSSITIK